VSKGGDKSNLFIFITPHIVRNQAEAAAIYQQKWGDIEKVQGGLIRMNENRAIPKTQLDRKE